MYQGACAMQNLIAALQNRGTNARMKKRMSVVVVEPARERALEIVDGLRDVADVDLTIISEISGLAKRIAAHDPDVVLADISNPTRDVIEEFALASSPLDRPVALFVDESDEALTQTAIDAGLSAYVVDGLRPERLKPVLQAAIARFNMVRRMREELDATKQALEQRKFIDRAKGLLMKARGISEDEAYNILRKAAMDQGKKISEVAQAIVTAADLLS